MRYLIDKNKIVREIEKRIKETESMQPKFDQFWAGQISAFKGILKILDTLEIKEIDSEKEIQNIIYNRFHDFYGIVNSETGEYANVNDFMAKSYTSKEQSEMLIKLGIPIKSADMWYQHIGYSIIDGKEKKKYFPMVIRDNISDDELPCWSLAALMNLLPSELTERGEYSETTYRIDIRKYALTDNVDIYQIAYGNYHWHEDGSCSWLDMINSGEKEELIDAVFQMICWLKENGKI